MKICYGILNNSIDVTDICLSQLTKNNVITIPCGETMRSNYFSDPLYGVLKKIIISNVEYDDSTQIKINLIDGTITTINANDINKKLEDIHSKLKLDYGSFREELPEQRMVARYLTGNEKVLEIGGNIGRNSLIIASILDNSKNLVTLECDSNIAIELVHNRDLNGFNFHVENSALSKRKLIQKDWNTIPSETLLNGYKWVNTITLNELKIKYNIIFDTLVLDCEGAFYFILMDMPEILDNINLIIMENDYYDLSKKKYINKILDKHCFSVDYIESGGWGPCYNNFFEVWKKNE